MAKDTFYFSHDYNSRSDEKIKLLIRKHGILGYGIFWAIVEDLYNNANALRTDSEGIAFDLRVDKKIVESILNDFDLFVMKDYFFGSLSVERRLNDRNEKSKKARDSANSRWLKAKEDANAMQTQCDGNAIKESKGKEIKEIKEIKAKKDKSEKVFSPPTLLDVVSYFSESGYTEDAGKRAFNYYDCAAWIDSKGNKVRNWKQKMQAVWFKDENKKQSEPENKTDKFFANGQWHKKTPLQKYH